MANPNTGVSVNGKPADSKSATPGSSPGAPATTRLANGSASALPAARGEAISAPPHLNNRAFLFWDGPARATCGAARRRGRRSGTVPTHAVDARVDARQSVKLVAFG